MQTTGNDMNAGSTNADSAAVTQTNGSWDITADTFIATAGTPFSGVNVGDWASIYNDGVTSGAVYVAQVTSVNSLGASITLSTTAKYGTKPASGATGKSCKVSGAWASLAVVTSLFASVTVPASTRINIKAGTYANTTTDRTFGSAGTTTAPIWWRGYNTTPGDIESNNSLTKPSITFTTGRFLSAAAYQLFSHLDVSGAQVAAGSGQITVSAGPAWFWRCRVECTAANANSRALNHSGGGLVGILGCWLKSNAAADIINHGSAGACIVHSTVFDTGKHGLVLGAASNILVAFCIFRSQTGDAIRQTTGARLFILNNTIYAPTSDGVELTVAPLIGVIMNNIFSSYGGYGINNSSGTNTALVFRLGNDFYNGTSGTENGFGDMPSIGQLDESSDPFTNAGTGDFSLLSTALALAGAFPGAFENLGTLKGYLDNGAVQLQQQSSSSIFFQAVHDAGMTGRRYA